MKAKQNAKCSKTKQKKRLSAMALHLLNLFFVDVFLLYLPLPQQGTPTCFAKALILLKYILKKRKNEKEKKNGIGRVPLTR